MFSVLKHAAFFEVRTNIIYILQSKQTQVRSRDLICTPEPTISKQFTELAEAAEVYSNDDGESKHRHAQYNAYCLTDDSSS